jgi:hypothetical protein
MDWLLRLKQLNLRGRAQRNVAHRYDLDDRLYAQAATVLPKRHRQVLSPTYQKQNSLPVINGEMPRPDSPISGEPC